MSGGTHTPAWTWPSPRREPPLPPTHLLRRDRLAAPTPRSRATLRGHGTVVVVTGLVGAGKSTLLSSWAADLRAAGQGAGWASLQDEDDDPVVLQDLVLGALHDALPARVRQQLAQPGSTAEDGDGTEAERGLTGQVAEAVRRAGAPIWLMLDDVQVIQSDGAVLALDRLLQWAPPNLHIVMAARSDPRVSLGRLRLQERLLEIRDAELRLDEDETAQLLAAEGLDLSGEHVHRLWQLTEGWVASVALAAMTLRSGRDVGGVLDGFGTDGGLWFLIEEVLHELPEETHTFLLDTCLPERLSTEMAELLSGRDDAGQLLHHLADTNSLVSVFGAEDRSYRYHTLLRGYLVARLADLSGQRSRAQHLRIARFLHARGDDAEALDHAISSRDRSTVFTLLHEDGLRLLLEGHHDVVDRAIGHLLESPSDEQPRRRFLHVLAAIIALDFGDLPRAEAHLESAGGRYREPTAPAAPSAVLPRRLDRLLSAAWLYRDRLRGDLDPAVVDAVLSSASRLGGAEAVGQSDLRALEHVTAGIALIWLGRFDEAVAVLESVFVDADVRGHDFVVMTCAAALSTAHTALGTFAEMRQWAQYAIDYATARGWAASPRLVPAYVCAAATAHDGLDPGRAAELIGVAEAILESGAAPLDAPSGATGVIVAPEVVRSVRAVRSFIDFDRAAGNPAEQRRIVRARHDEVLALASERFSRTLVAFEVAEHHRMALACGEVDAARASVELAERRLGAGGETAVLAAQLAVRLDREEEARHLLQGVLARPERVPVVHLRVVGLLLEASLAHRNDQPTVAHDALLRGLAIARRLGSVRLVLEVAPEVFELLVEGRGRFGAEEDFVEHVIESALTVAALHEPTHRYAVSRGPAAAPVLTPRELSLLQDLPSMLTVPELARARAVSPNTVKTQLRSLFAKLGVGNRREAVAEGRREGLI
ncbi:LuxR C-terminal-related transcriptional regulator [Humibacillus xanthopallidus]|uniref:LuxR family maltose regulon positive regulatory protein n=1 Tax=Humibacillus xanthopallidus TaxID=412689 RepID=A0A543HI24_9MICO|nr:LuxR C-terminal-related transcriptional regulator [Humibacillus xanthopallidus]TQM57970.1 LuxR family maltose regulon positive regulatory protein [Humibacillus xanthopallidus]